MAITLNGDSGITTPTYGGTDTSEYLVPVTAFKNRIINGAMMIAQRGTSASPTTTGYFTIDRFEMGGSATIVSSVAPTITQSTNAPANFNYSFGYTNTNAVTITTATNSLFIRQVIEGNNIADLGWGTADAKTVTLSFWVRSSLTGTFGGSLRNGSVNRSYPFTYTISAANTWEQKTVTIAGDTSGTWASDNTSGISIIFSLGAGSDRLGTAGAWNGNNNTGATGQVQLCQTAGATFYITGVQLEKGSTATSFDYRPYGTELALCQRYYEKSYDISVAPLTNNSNGTYNITGSTNAGGNIVIPIKFAVAKRTAPTLTGISQAGTSGSWQYERSGASALTTANAYWVGENGGNFFGNTGANWVSCNFYGHWTASAEL